MTIVGVTTAMTLAQQMDDGEALEEARNLTAQPVTDETTITPAVLAILLIPAALCYTFGKMVGDTRQGWALLLDCREGPTRYELAKLSGHVGLTAVIDDAAERRLAADVAYYPPVPQALALDWTSSRCAPRIRN